MPTKHNERTARAAMETAPGPGVTICRVQFDLVIQSVRTYSEGEDV
jgi:hypothetical protein